MVPEIGGGAGPIMVMGGCWVCFCFFVLVTTSSGGGGGLLASNGGWPMIMWELSMKIDGGGPVVMVVLVDGLAWVIYLI